MPSRVTQAKADDYATRVGGMPLQISPSPPNKNRNSDTKGLRFLLTNSFVGGTIKLINTVMLLNLLYQKERHNERVCSTPHLW